MGHKSMLYAYVKQLIVEGEGKFNIVRIGAETEEALAVKRDHMLACDFQDATEEEYTAQFAARTAPVESEADKDLGNEKSSGEETANT